MKQQRRLIERAFHPLVITAALLPLALLVIDIGRGELGAEPIREITLRTGKSALVLLVLCLACTPLNTLFGFRLALKVRRSLGLAAFLYASLHFLIFIGLDYGFDWELLQGALVKKRYALAGLAAGLIMLPLAVTSFDYWKRRLGKKWKRLHRLVYLAGALAAVHFIWLVKPGVREPWLWAGLVALLLFLRVPAVRRAATRLRSF